MRINIIRLAWAVWALTPVAVIAYHFGPGQAAYARDRAARLQRRAVDAERAALVAQNEAYSAHLAALAARRTAAQSGADADTRTAADATEVERQAYARAADAWQRTSELIAEIEELVGNTATAEGHRLRWARHRADIRGGDVWAGVMGLEALLRDVDPRGNGDNRLARPIREQLAAGYYYAALLQRRNGEPPSEWRIESGKARQHFRFLAEQARRQDRAQELARGYEQNLELVLNLEQSALREITGRPLPREAPMVGLGQRPGRDPGRSPRPGDERDGRGAGPPRNIGPGW